MLELDVSSCQSLTDSSIKKLVESCPYLSTLCLEECKFTEGGVNCIAENGYSLKTLKLAYCKGVTNASLEKLSNGCPGLIHLDLSYCTNVTIDELQKVLVKWQTLKILNLRGFHQLTTEAIQHPNIQSLNLSWCKNLQDSAIDQIAEGCPNLTCLDLAWAGKVTANAVHKLVQNVPTLTSLNLRGCTKVTFLTLKYLANGNITIYS